MKTPLATLLLLLCMGFVSYHSSAQVPQGTPYVMSPAQPLGSYSLNPDCVVSLRVILHVMRDGQGQGGVNSSEALDAFDYLNTSFADANISFVHADPQNPVRFIDDDSYYPMNFGYYISVDSNYTEANAINIFIVDRDPLDSLFWEGFTGDVPDAKLFIRSDLITTSAIIHEMGHCLGLWHTHGRAGNDQELVTRGFGANCATAGDEVCDTPAEPYNSDNGISGYVYMPTSCGYFGTFTDANNDTYDPDTQNYMGYAPKGCRVHFTDGQIVRMREHIAYEHLLAFNTLTSRTVRFANIVGGQEHGEGEISVREQDGTVFHSDVSPYEYELPTCVEFRVRTEEERLPLSTETEKHQTWNNDFATYKLQKDLQIEYGTTIQSEYAHFRTMKPVAITVDHEAGTPTSEVAFMDPWHLHDDGSQPGAFLSFASPHSPTGAWDKQSGGIFLHDNGNPLSPAYAIQVPRYLDDNQTAKSLPLAVGDWVCTGVFPTNVAAADVTADPSYPDMLPGNVIANTLTRQVLFNQENADLRAAYKAHRCSINSDRPTAGNAQRRIVFDKQDPTLPGPDVHYAVYESGGGVYCIRSDDDGATWGPEVLVSEYGATCKRPAIALRDHGTSDGVIYISYVDEDASEVVLKSRAHGSAPFTWTEIDRITVTDPSQCAPAIAAQQSGNEEGVFMVWEDVGVVINQVATNVLKFSIYEQDVPRQGGYYTHGGNLTDDFLFHDAVLAEGQFNWRGQRRVPRHPSVTLMETYPRFAVTWREEPGFLFYEDITWDTGLSGVLINSSLPESIPCPGITAQTAASLCEYNPGSNVMTVAYEADQQWTNWPVATSALSWPLSLGTRLYYPVTYPYLLRPTSPSVNPNPSRVYVRKRSGAIDAPSASWNTVARVLNIHRPDLNISAPSVGSEGSLLRVAVNNGYGGISVADLDVFFPTIHSSVIQDGFDPNVTVHGEKLHSVYSQPENGFPSPIQHRLMTSQQGLRKTTTEITDFMREVMVSQDSSLAVYGICMPHLLLCDSTRVPLDWSYASFDTVALGKDATLGELTRTTSFTVPSGASFEYATELFGRYAGSFDLGFDIRIDFHDAQSGALLLRDSLGAAALPTDSAWYVLSRVDLSSLVGNEVYMQLTLSETTGNMLVDIVDIFDVSVPLEKSDRVTSRVPVASTVQLYQNYPNPFNPSTSITFNIPEAGDVHLSIHDNLGRRVTTALSRHLDAGLHTVDFHAGHLSSGVYFYRLTANGETHTRRMTLLR